MTNTIALNHHTGHYALDTLCAFPDGEICIAGWSVEVDDAPLPVVERDGTVVAPTAVYRTCRPDVASAFSAKTQYLGFEAIYPPVAAESARTIRVSNGGSVVYEGTIDPSRGEPAYRDLLHSRRVYGRDNVYGSGPPAAINSPEIESLALSLHGRTLDFGCGAGYLVRRMRESGIEAFGVEIDRPDIRAHLQEGAAPFVTLYDGSLPLPFADASFDCAITSEVVEHIPGHEAIIAELARVVRRRLVVTVPDASAIPRLYHANVVPWHLLESTHVNFFTQESLAEELSRHFTTIRMSKAGRTVTNGIPWYTSIVAVCDK